MGLRESFQLAGSGLDLDPGVTQHRKNWPSECLGPGPKRPYPSLRGQELLLVETVPEASLPKGPVLAQGGRQTQGLTAPGSNLHKV